MEIRYKLHKNQGSVWTDKSRYRVLVAGRRFGKTTLAIHELFQNAILNDNSLNWYLSPTYTQSKMIAWKLLNDVIPKQMIVKKYEVELRIILDNGSEIALKGCDNEDSLRGVGVSFVVLDEYAQMKPNVWFEIIRPMLTDTKGRSLFIGTPKGKNSLWELYLRGQRNEDEFKSWRFKTVDNPFIDPEEVEKAKQELPQRYFNQEYEASFEDYVGLIYPEFNQAHIIEPRYIDSVYSKIGAIDPATTGITGVLKAFIDENGIIMVYGEYYELNKRASEVSEKVNEDNVKWYIDPASFAQTIQKEGKLYSLYDEYADNGIRPEKAETDVDAGINRVGEMFKTDKIKIFSTCKSLIYELERYHWAEERETVAGIIKPKPYKKDDHLVDCLRYLVMSRTQKASLDVEEVYDYASPKMVMKRQSKKTDYVH